MPHVFVSHAEEDSVLAIRLSNALKQLGFRPWCYELDSTPGVSFVEESVKQIHDCPAFLLLISSHSLDSHEVATELRVAHRAERRILPVLIDVSHSQLSSRHPEWSAILGLATSIRMDSSSFDSIVSRLALGLRAAEIEPSLQLTLKRTENDNQDNGINPDRIRKIWASDAHQIDIRDLDEVVFRNRVIDDFLNRQNRTFLSASKGLGKTLLLTYKRRLLQDAYQNGRGRAGAASVCFVPEGKPYLDFMGDLIGLSGDHKQLLSRLANTKKCWSFALRVSAVSFSSYTLDPEDTLEVGRFPNRMQAWLRGHRIEPTLVFKELLSHSVSDINRLLDRTETFLEQKYRAIHSGIFFFIDKADQAMRNLPRDAWIHVQAGLIEAAWDAMTANSHVKIFASIRQEAFANYESDIKANLTGATATIYYLRSELRDLLDQLTRCYEGRNSFREFIHVHSVRNPKSHQMEDAFQYLERHTLSRPRDLVIIASKLSQHQDELSEPAFRRIVDDTSSGDIAANVFEENRVFLDSLRDRTGRFRFLSLIPKNILGREETYHVSAQFNGIDVETLNMFGRDSTEIHHPFWELYNTGLLGVVEEHDDGSENLVQRFKQPADITQEAPTDLPDSPYYLIHPSLDALIRRQHRSAKYHVSGCIIIGHELPWFQCCGPFSRVESSLPSISDPKLRAQVAALLEQVAVHHAGREPQPAHSRDPLEWEALVQALEEAGRDDIFVWLDELL